MRLTNRDIQIMEFIKNNSIISSSQIQRLFNMSPKVQNRRMNILMKEFPIKKLQSNPVHRIYGNNYKDLLKNENVYYMNKKVKCIEHDLLLNEFYIKIKEMQSLEYSIIEYDTRYKINVDGFVVIPDARLVIKCNGIEYEYLIELENNKSFNYKKYYTLEQKGFYCCPVVVISNRRTQNYCKHLEVINLRLNMSNVDKFIDDFMCQNDNLSENKDENFMTVNIESIRSELELF